MRSVVYKPYTDCEILHKEMKDGFQILIISYGTHPCAYIGVPDSSLLAKLDTEKLDEFVEVHGGFTFSSAGRANDIFDEGYYWYGWDYAHAGDWQGYYTEHDSFAKLGYKKWTTEEIYDQCLKALEQFKKLQKRLLHSPYLYDKLKES